VTGDRIVLRGVSKFYGEVLGVNHVSLTIPPGLTSLVGPNGSGKSTLMHLLTGLLRPTQGTVSVLGIPPERPEQLFRLVGYCTQYDSFPAGATGLGLLRDSLALHGLSKAERDARAWQVLELVGLADAARRRIAGYSKGMRQRIKLGQAIAHDPHVLVLDEPLNGLDPMARAEVIDLMRRWADEGRHVIVSSHILHEVDAISDGVILMHGGSVVAEGAIRAVRGEISGHPMQVLVRCRPARAVAPRLLELAHVVEVRLVEEDDVVLVRTRDADAFFRDVAPLVLASGADVETVAPADEDVGAVYDYLIGSAGGTT